MTTSNVLLKPSDGWKLATNEDNFLLTNESGKNFPYQAFFSDAGQPAGTEIGHTIEDKALVRNGLTGDLYVKAEQSVHLVLST